MKIFSHLMLLLAPLVFFSCHHSSTTLKVAASSTPHAEMLEVIQEEMKEKGYSLEILVVDDYHLPNRLLAEKQVDANFFQHLPFLESEMREFGYKVTPLAKIHLEPLGIYSHKYKSILEISGGTVTLPSDPSNEARALELLQSAGLIKLKKGISHFPTILDISENPLSLKFKELDAPLLPRTLKDADLAVIPGNFVLQAKMNPREALFLESLDSPYANILVVRQEEENRADLLLLAELLKSKKVGEFLEKKYGGVLLLFPTN